MSLSGMLGGGGAAWNDYQSLNVPGSSGGGVSGSSLQPAMLEIFEPPKDPQNPGKLGSVSAVEFRLNPHTITYSKSAQWGGKSATTAQTAQTPQFQSSDSAQMSFEVLFDSAFDLANGKANVVGPVNELLACCAPTKATMSAGAPCPPWVRLHWGQATYPYMIMKSVNVTYPVFSADGVPLRASCKLSLQEVAMLKAGTNPTSGALSAKGSHPVVAGDSLQSIAFQHYGSAALWRAIAEANGIDDPAKLAVGVTLLVPSITDGRD